jgi:hypothetical protein
VPNHERNTRGHASQIQAIANQDSIRIRRHGIFI